MPKARKHTTGLRATGIRPRVVLGLVLALAAGSAAANGPAVRAAGGPMKIADAALEPVEWSALDSWAADDHSAGFAAFLASCKAVLNGRAAVKDGRPMRSALMAACRRARAAVTADSAGTRRFFEDNFRPVRISKLGDAQGFLTGYYEPIVDGSRFPGPLHTAPMYRRPGDLVALGKRRKADGFPNKGAEIGRKVGKHKIVPYYDRAEIEDGALDGRRLEICWLRDPVDAFFIHIQGSARVRLEDGVMLRLNYDAHNGHPYTPVGRILIERGIVPREEMSMDRIRGWMHANPDDGKVLRRQNRSYVFFRITGLSDHDEAVGAQGVPLTPVRSIAVDKALHVYGTPFFIEADLPIADPTPTTKFGRLMVAQDTGSAIVGPARADIYFGAGDEAGLVSGRIKQPGRFVMLVPREADPVEAGKLMPVPRPKPKITEAAASTGGKAAARAKPRPKPTPKR